MIRQNPDHLLQTQQVLMPANHGDIAERLDEMGAVCLFEGTEHLEVFTVPNFTDVIQVSTNTSEQPPEAKVLGSLLRTMQHDRQRQLYANDLDDKSPATDQAAKLNEVESPGAVELDQQVRILKTGDKNSISFSGEALEIPITADELQIANQGLRQIGRLQSSQEHWRVSFALPAQNAKLHVRSWPGMPTYAQIETPDPQNATHIAEMLGYDAQDLQTVTQKELFTRYSITPEYVRFGDAEVEVTPAQVEQVAKEVIAKRAPHLTPEQIDLIANHYLDAEYAGKRTHGLRKLCWDSQYYNQRKPDGPIVLQEKGAVARLDGNQEIGPIAAQMCVDMVIAKAKETGIASVAMTGSQRFGVLATWTKQIAEAGLVGLLTVSTEPFTALHETATGVVGTNPLSIAVPYKESALVYDAAFSKAPVNTIWHNKLLGIQLPEDTFLDNTGQFTTDPFYARTVNVFGGSKGSALAFMLQVMSGPMLGAASHRAFSNPYENGFYMQAMDPEFFAGKDVFEAQVSELVASIKQAPLKDGYDEILLPGERSQRLSANVKQTDVLKIHQNIWNWLLFLRDSQ